MSEEAGELWALVMAVREWALEAAAQGADALPATELPRAEMDHVSSAAAGVHAPAVAPTGGSAAAWMALASTAREAPATAEVGLQRVREELGDCHRCALSKSRSKLIFGSGPPDARLMVIGDGPSRDEDRAGQLFISDQGDMLDKMLENVLGVSRAEIYLTGAVKCASFPDAHVRAEELASCTPFLHAQIRATRPKMILLMGGMALSALHPQAGPVSKARGQWLVWEGIPVLPTFHPGYLVHQPSAKRLVFEDLKALRTRLEALGPT